MSCYLLRKILNDHTFVLGQLSPTAVDTEDVADSPQHLTVAVYPVESIPADVYLRTTGNHQAPAKLLFCTEALGP